MLQAFLIVTGKRSQELLWNFPFTYHYVYVEDVKVQTAALNDEQLLYSAFGPTGTQMKLVKPVSAKWNFVNKWRLYSLTNLTNSMQQSTSREPNWFSGTQEIPYNLWNPDSFLLNSQELATCP